MAKAFRVCLGEMAAPATPLRDHARREVLENWVQMEQVEEVASICSSHFQTLFLLVLQRSTSVAVMPETEAGAATAVAEVLEPDCARAVQAEKVGPVLTAVKEEIQGRSRFIRQAFLNYDRCSESES